MSLPKNRINIGPQEKYLLTIYEASEYFGIGLNRLREMSKDLSINCFVTVGKGRNMVIRPRFEKYIEEHRFI